MATGRAQGIVGWMGGDFDCGGREGSRAMQSGREAHSHMQVTWKMGVGVGSVYCFFPRCHVCCLVSRATPIHYDSCAISAC